MAYVIAHFSDLHLGRDEADFDRTEFLLADALERGADHIVVAGDLLDHGNLEDLRRFKATLRRLSLWHPSRMTVVPGNHDVIGGHFHANRRAALADDSEKRNRRKRRFTRAFAPLERGVRRVARQRFPYVKRLGPVAVLGVDTVDTNHMAQGLVGEPQIARLYELLRGLKRARELPVVVMHHRPIDVDPRRTPWYYRVARSFMGSMNLADSDELLSAISEGGGDLVLCGHWHLMGDDEYCERASGVRVFTQGRSGGMDSAKKYEGVYYSYDLLTVRGGSVRRRTIEFEMAEIDAEIYVDIE